jgi:hypothetical protein
MNDQLDIFKPAPRWKPAGFDAAKLTSEEEVVLSYLKILHVGARRAIKQLDLAKCCHMDDRKLQMILKHLTETHHIALAASVAPPYGVYLIENEEEARQYGDQLHGRAMSMLRREAIIRRIRADELIGQMRLEEVSSAEGRG